jgi:hypothetical protein
VEASCGRRIDYDGLMASLDRVLCIWLDDTMSVLESCLDYMVNVLEGSSISSLQKPWQ